MKFRRGRRGFHKKRRVPLKKEVHKVERKLNNFLKGDLKYSYDENLVTSITPCIGNTYGSSFTSAAGGAAGGGFLCSDVCNIAQGDGANQRSAASITLKEYFAEMTIARLDFGEATLMTFRVIVAQLKTAPGNFDDRNGSSTPGWSDFITMPADDSTGVMNALTVQHPINPYRKPNIRILHDEWFNLTCYGTSGTALAVTGRGQNDGWRKTIKVHKTFKGPSSVVTYNNAQASPNDYGAISHNGIYCLVYHNAPAGFSGAAPIINCLQHITYYS